MEENKQSLPETNIPGISTLHRDELRPDVRTYTDNLQEQIHQGFESLGIKNQKEFDEVAAKEKIPVQEFERIQKLMEKLLAVSKTGEIPAEDEESAKLLRAKEIMGEDFLGIDEIRTMEEMLKDVGINVKFYPESEINEMSPLPYTEEDLKLAKENGEMLVLRPEKMTIDGMQTDITIMEFRKLFEQDPLGQGTHAIYPNTWYTEEDFARKTAEFSSGWALVKKEIINGSTNKNWDEQEALLKTYGEDLKNKGAASFDIKRRTAFEAIWDTMLYYTNTGSRLLENTFDWTSTCASNDHFVHVGDFDSNGLGVSTWNPVNWNPSIGVCPSR